MCVWSTTEEAYLLPYAVSVPLFNRWHHLEWHTARATSCVPLITGVLTGGGGGGEAGWGALVLPSPDSQPPPQHSPFLHPLQLRTTFRATSLASLPAPEEWLLTPPPRRTLLSTPAAHLPWDRWVSGGRGRETGDLYHRKRYGLCFCVSCVCSVAPVPWSSPPWKQRQKPKPNKEEQHNLQLCIATEWRWYFQRLISAEITKKVAIGHCEVIFGPSEQVVLLFISMLALESSPICRGKSRQKASRTCVHLGYTSERLSFNGGDSCYSLVLLEKKMSWKRLIARYC